MTFSRADIRPDTIRANNIAKQDSGNIQSFTSVERKAKNNLSLARYNDIAADTTSVCSRNNIVDITFYDSCDVVFASRMKPLNEFPFIFTEINRRNVDEAHATVLKHLKPGEERTPRSTTPDWFTGIIILAAILYSLVSTYRKDQFPGISRFFLFRGINDPSSRDLGGLFHWQSTIINFVSFLVISIFTLSGLRYFRLLPGFNNDILVWSIIMGVIILAVTLRHLLCILIGNASGQPEAFREYLLAIYQSYRYSALFLFFVLILILYTIFIPVPVLYYAGLAAFGLMYLFRATRLFFIFLNRKISIFYLILYLCALEILPVLVIIRYLNSQA